MIDFVRVMMLIFYYIEKAELADVLAGSARGAAENASGRTQKDPVYVVVEEGN